MRRKDDDEDDERGVHGWAGGGRAREGSEVRGRGSRIGMLDTCPNSRAQGPPAKTPSSQVRRWSSLGGGK